MNSLILLSKAPLNRTNTVLYCGFVVPVIRSKRPLWIKLLKFSFLGLHGQEFFYHKSSPLLEWLGFDGMSWNCIFFLQLIKYALV